MSTNVEAMYQRENPLQLFLSANVVTMTHRGNNMIVLSYNMVAIVYKGGTLSKILISNVSETTAKKTPFHI